MICVLTKAGGEGGGRERWGLSRHEQNAGLPHKREEPCRIERHTMFETEWLETRAERLHV